MICPNVTRRAVGILVVCLCLWALLLSLTIGGRDSSADTTSTAWPPVSSSRDGDSLPKNAQSVHRSRSTSSYTVRLPNSPQVVAEAVSLPSNLTSMAISYPAMPHPSCLALRAVLNNVKHVPPVVAQASRKSATGSKTTAARLTPVPLPAVHEYWREYAKAEFLCYKHGGHYQPGLPRASGITAVDSPHTRHLQRWKLIDVFVWGGDVYQIVPASVDRGEKTYTFSAYFPMVGGNWPQPIVDELKVKLVHSPPPWEVTRDNTAQGPANNELRDGETRNSRVGLRRRVLQKPVAYFQPPTDFGSVYHSVVETILPLFATVSAAVPSRIQRDESPLPLSVLTSRPRTTKYAFRDSGCTRSFEKCLNTPWGAMFLALTVADDHEQEALIYGDVSGAEVARRHSVSTPEHIGPAVATLYGIAQSDQQLRQVPSSSEYPFVEHVHDDIVLHFSELLVGNPTHCEPLWGGDPQYAEILNARRPQMLRGSFAAQAHRLVAASGTLAHPLDEPLVAHFNHSFSHCQEVLRQFRRFFVDLSSKRSAVAGSGGGRWFAERHSPIAAGKARPVHIVLTSRKGDWARQLLDEDELLALLTRHVKGKYPAGSTVRVVKFYGSISQQLVEQLRVNETTLFIGNHGANLLNSVFLRPNAGVITLSLRNPGFYPLSLYPDWLHVRDMVVEQMCNRRLNKGKCRWMEGNNNDMFLSGTQRDFLLRMIDDIVAEQESHPRA